MLTLTTVDTKNSGWKTAVSRRPIQYVDQIGVRFSDLDMYGHVNSKNYLDMVNTARTLFLERELKMSLAEITARGYGFFMTKSTINFKRPIAGFQNVLVTSFAREIHGGRSFTVPFSISTLDGAKTFSDGELEFRMIDMKTLRTCEAPDWVVDLLFEPL